MEFSAPNHPEDRPRCARNPEARTTVIAGYGIAIARSLAGTGKKLTLELGGKAANIVFDDAPIDQAVEGIIGGIYFNQGHVFAFASR